MNLTREQFIQMHIATCQAGPCPKYDNKKPNGGGYHSAEYSRRKCAVNLFRKLIAADKNSGRYGQVIGNVK